MFILPGSSALTPPRFMALASALRSLDSGLRLDDAYFLYAIAHGGEVDRGELSRLLQPSTAETAREALPADDHCLVVVPRLGKFRLSRVKPPISPITVDSPPLSA